jgi:hypothetical protein
MTGSSERAGRGDWNYWRIARWSAVPILLLIPLVMMQSTPDWHWGPGGFVLAGIVIGAPVLLYEVAASRSMSSAYGIAAAVALAASFLTVWTTIVRDDGNGIGFFMLIMAAAVGGFATWFRPAGMTRAMLGVAIMQMLLGTMIATAPPIASTPNGSLRAILSSVVFAGLWLVSAAFFRVSAKGDH